MHLYHWPRKEAIIGLPVLLDLGEEGEFAGGGEEAGFDGVGGELAELVEGEAD